MKKEGLEEFFESYISKHSFFKNKKLLQPTYEPNKVEHRDEQIKQIAQIIAPLLKNEKPSNLFIYGKTGTGKTLCVKHVIKQIEEISKKRDLPIKIIYINCKLRKVTDTEYRLIAQLIRELGKEIPHTGLPTNEVYSIFFNLIDKQKQIILLVLDEMDQLVDKAGDEILYNFTRINSELKNAQLSIVGISNNLLFKEALDPRVKSSLSEEELVFPPYNALQIQAILKARSEDSIEKGVISPGVIEKCAAFAAREHGDARRALELLRVAAEVAQREDATKIEIKHLDMAEDKIESDRILDVVKTYPKQHQATLYSIILVRSQRNEGVYTGEIYNTYKQLCTKNSIRPLTQRRISDIIAEFDMIGIINAKTISKGRYGRTREINTSLPEEIESKIIKILQEELTF